MNKIISNIALVELATNICRTYFFFSVLLSSLHMCVHVETKQNVNRKLVTGWENWLSSPLSGNWCNRLWKTWQASFFPICWRLKQPTGWNSWPVRQGLSYFQDVWGLFAGGDPGRNHSVLWYHWTCIAYPSAIWYWFIIFWWVLLKNEPMCVTIWLFMCLALTLCQPLPIARADSHWWSTPPCRREVFFYHLL